MTPREVAALIRFHRNTVKRIPASDLPYLVVSPRGDRRYAERDVQDWIDRHTVSTPPGAAVAR